MKRRDFIFKTGAISLFIGFTGCAINVDEATDDQKKEAAKKAPTGSQSGSSRTSTRRVTGPSDLKSLAAILQQARCPLTEGQINFLQTLKPGPEFNQRMGEVLNDTQLEAVKSSSRRR